MEQVAGSPEVIRLQKGPLKILKRQEHWLELLLV
jgi:hypothetical protein